MAFMVAYTVAAIGPVSLGALRDATGDFRASFLVLTGLAVVEMAIVTRLTPARRHAGV
jgi:CP family cyanate transporter-like MFS transporter